MTPVGDDEQRDDDDLSVRRPADRDRGDGRSIASDFGWDRPRSTQPPGDRVTWDAPVTRVRDGSDSLPPAAQTSGGSTRPTPGDPRPVPPVIPSDEPAGSTPTVRAPRAADDRPSPPVRPNPPERPAPPTPAFGNPAPTPPSPPTTPPAPARPAPPSTPSAPAAPAPPAPPTPAAPSAPAGGAWGARSAESRPTPPSSLRATPAERPAIPERRTRSSSGFAFDDGGSAASTPPPPARPEPEPPAALPDPPAPAPAATTAPESASSDEGDRTPLQSQLSALAERADKASESAGDRGAGNRAALTELSQQLAATQSQIAAIGAQLTTLSHRISYDLERSSQTTSERLQRDIEALPTAVSLKVGGDLGPPIDDLTEQVEADLAKITAAVDGVQEQLGPRLTTIGEIVDGLPLSNVEILSALQSLGTDLEDRFVRFSTRVADQLTQVERSTAAEVTKLRTQLDDLRIAVGKPAGGADTIERMAGQIERLIQRTPGGEDLVESLELLVSEHLDVLRDNIDARVGALGPVLQEELEAVRAESLGSVTAAEEGLVARLEALEASLGERLDLALTDQVEAVDGVVAARQEEIVGAIAHDSAARIEELSEVVGGTAARFDELSEVVGATTSRLDEVVGALAELREVVEASAAAAAEAAEHAAEAPSGGASDEALEAIAAEIKALKRRISLRLEQDDSPLTPEQIAAIATQIADHLH